MIPLKPIAQGLPAKVPLQHIPVVNTSPAKAELTDNLAPGAIVLGRFQLQGTIGKGNFSNCYKAADILTGQMVAVKTYQKGCKNAVVRFERQIKILNELAEPLMGSKWSSKDPRRWNEDLLRTDPRDLFLHLVAHSQANDPFNCIVTELAQYSLYKYLHRSEHQNGQALPLSKQEVRTIGHSLMMATAGLHAKSLVHLDIKPENVMFFGRTWKLIDVEGCIHAGKGIPFDCPTVAFSPIYCAPEFAKAILAQQALIPASCGFDVWSTGMTIAELATGRAPLKDFHESQKRAGGGYQQASKLLLQWLAETTAAPRIYTGGDRQLDDLFYNWLLVPNPTRRKELAESLHHQFLTSPVQVSAPCNSNSAQPSVASFNPPPRQSRSYVPLPQSGRGNTPARPVQPMPLQCPSPNRIQTHDGPGPRCTSMYDENRASTKIQNFFKKTLQKRKMAQPKAQVPGQQMARGQVLPRPKPQGCPQANSPLMMSPKAVAQAMPMQPKAVPQPKLQPRPGMSQISLGASTRSVPSTRACQPKARIQLGRR